jgi:hypothetical protein
VVAWTYPLAVLHVQRTAVIPYGIYGSVRAFWAVFRLAHILAGKRKNGAVARAGGARLASWRLLSVPGRRAHMRRRLPFGVKSLSRMPAGVALPLRKSVRNAQLTASLPIINPQQLTATIGAKPCKSRLWSVF